MTETDKHPAPSLERYDPHPAREETSAQTSPETRQLGSPRMERELSDDRKINGYIHDGKDRTETFAQNAPARPDAMGGPNQKAQRSGTGETLPEAPFRSTAATED